MHKPTLIRVLRMFREILPENPQIAHQLAQGVAERAASIDPSVTPSKLLAGAGYHTKL